MKRDTTIALSDEEKKRLNEITAVVYDDPDAVPYGQTISLLIDSFEEEATTEVSPLAQSVN